MGNELLPGDRVMIRSGETGTVIRVEGGFIVVQLDNTMQKKVPTITVKKIEATSGDEPT